MNKEELGKGQQQVAESRIRLLKLKADRDLDVSAVRVTGDERESQRRSREEEQRQVSIQTYTCTQRTTLKWVLTLVLLYKSQTTQCRCIGLQMLLAALAAIILISVALDA